LFGLRGPAGAGNPLSGSRVTYLFGANSKSRFWSVFYADKTKQDCSKAGSTTVPIGKWSCIQWEADSDALKIDLWVDGAYVSDFALRDHGNACVPPADVNSPWFGPQADEFYVGLWSFHNMDADIDLWVDNVTNDTKKVACP
jgi:hypothetical protein